MNDQEMNRLTRFAAPLGALAIAAAVAIGAIAAVAQTPGPSSPPASGGSDPAVGTAPSPTQPPTPGPVPAPQSPVGATKPDAAPGETADIVGLEVIDKPGQVVGNVTKVDRLPSGQIRTIEISFGGFLGIGAKILRVPADKVERSGQRMVLNLAPEQIRTMTK